MWKPIQNSKFYFFLLIILAIAVNLPKLTDGYLWGDTDLYLLQLESIFDGTMEELKMANKFTVDNSNHNTGPYLYPWGYPFALAPIYYFFGMDIYAFKILTLFMYIGSLYLIFILLRNKLSDLALLFLIGIFAFNRNIVIYLNRIESDIPYLFISLLTIFLIQKIIIEKKQLVSPATGYILIGLCMFLSYFFRTNGIIFIPVLIAVQVILRLKKHPNLSRAFSLNKINLLPLIPYGIFLILKVLSSNILPNGSEAHFDRLSIITLESILSNISYYFTLPAGFYPRYISIFIYFSALPFTCIGVFKNFKNDYLYLLYLAGTWMILILWPFTPGIRLIFSILPFYFYFTFLGLKFFSIKLLNKTIRFDHAFGITVVAIFVVLHLFHFVNGDHPKLDGPHIAESQQMLKYIEENTEKNDLIVFRKPRTVRFYTKRNAIIEDRIEKIKNMVGSYIILDDQLLSNQANIDDLQKLKNATLAFSNERFKIYEIEKKIYLSQGEQ